MTITNNGPALTGNVDVALTNIIAGVADTAAIAQNTGLTTGVTLINATGQNNGSPMIQVSTTGLANGASITVPLNFSNPTNGQLNFTPSVLQE